MRRVLTLYVELHTMGFRDDKIRILDALQSLNFDHQARTGKNEDENHLAAGLLSVERAFEIVSATSGRQHENRDHHQVSYPKVWILKPVFQGEVWYIKGYFIGELTWFISFHPSKG